MTHGRVPTELRSLYYLLMRIEPKQDMDAMWHTHTKIEQISYAPKGVKIIQVYKWSEKLRMKLVGHIIRDIEESQCQ